MDIEWKKFTISQKNQLFITYIENELENNEKSYQNNTISDLIYSKNKLILNILKKDKKFLKQLQNNDVIFENNNIYEIKNIKKDKNNLIYYSNSNNKNLTQLKMTDYNYKVVKNFIEYEKRNKKR